MYLVIYQDGEEVNRITDMESVIASLLDNTFAWARGLDSISKARVKDYNELGEISFYNDKCNGKYVFKDVPFKWGYLNSWKMFEDMRKEDETKGKQGKS